jgi:beta-lactamase regulating signal transducer with metallopeptidase domain
MSPVHMHLMLNHVPVVGAVFVLLLLALALGKRSSEIGKVAIGLTVAIGLLATVVFLTGEPAEEAVEHVAGVSETLIHQHEDAAGVALLVAGTLAVLGLATLWWYWRQQLPRAVMHLALVAALALNAAMAWTAYLGGQIRHTEIRMSAGEVERNDDH